MCSTREPSERGEKAAAMDHDAKRGEGAEKEENSEVLHVVVASREALK